MFQLTSAYLKSKPYVNNVATLSVSVTMPASEFKKTKDLGALFGIDIGNFVYAQLGLGGYNPAVCSTIRAKNGLKTIELHYDIPAPRALALGLEGFRLKDGTIIFRHRAVNLLAARKPSLSLVGA